MDYKVDLIEAQRAAVNSELDTGQPAEPPACLVPPNGDDTFGPDTYGYNALVYIYDSTEAARVGYTTAMAHKKRRDFLAADADAPADQRFDHPGNGPDPPDPPPEPRKPRVLAYF